MRSLGHPCASHRCCPPPHRDFAKVARVHSRAAREAVTEATGHAARWAAPRAEAAIDWVTPRAQAAWRHGVAAAAPRVEEAARLLSPKIDIARDKLKDEVLPTIVDAVNRAAEVAAQSAGQAAGAPAIGVPAAASAACSASVSRATKKRHRVRRFLGWSALAALVGAIAYAMWTRREPDGDPWSEDDAWGDDPAAFVPTTQGSGETADGDGLAATAKDGLEDLAEVAGAAADAVGVKTGEAVRKVSTASKKAAAVAQTAIDKARRAADAGAEEPTPGPDHP